MNTRLLIYCLIMMFGTFISAVSQVLLKKAADRHYDSVIREYLNWRVIVAYSIFVAATLLSIYAYKVVPLSLGPILEATSYIYVTFFGVKIFGEKVGKMKAVGLVLIILGVVVSCV